MGFRGIERVTGINHNTIINWVRQAGLSLPDAPETTGIPKVAELDQLQTAVLLAFKSQEHAAANAFVGKKKSDLVVDSSQPRTTRNSRLGYR